MKTLVALDGSFAGGMQGSTSTSGESYGHFRPKIRPALMYVHKTMQTAVSHSQYDIKFAYFQEADTTWNVIQKVQEGGKRSELIRAQGFERRLDRRPRRRCTSHRVDTSQGALQDQRTLPRRKKYVLQRLLSRRRRSQCIYVNNDHEVAGQDAHCRQCCFFTCDGTYFADSKGREDHQKKRTSWNCKPDAVLFALQPKRKRTSKSSALTFNVKLVEDSRSYCRWVGHVMSWVTPTRDNQKRITHQRKEGRLLNATSNISYPRGGNKAPSTSILGYNQK